MWWLMDKFRQDKDSEFLNFEVNPLYTFLIIIFQYLHAHDWILSQGACVVLKVAKKHKTDSWDTHMESQSAVRFTVLLV